MLAKNSYITRRYPASLESWSQAVVSDLAEVKAALDMGPGCVLLSGLKVEEKTEDTERAFVDLASHLGRPKSRGNTNNVVWSVRPAKPSTDRPLAYSEQTGVAPLHTDSSYYPTPDTYLLFMVVNPADDGGGKSIVLSGEQLIVEFRKEPGGDKTVETLTHQPFPFSMSPAFHTEAMGSTRPIEVKPVLSTDIRIRFQIKAILEGFRRMPDLATPDKLKAVNHFNDFLMRHLSLEGERLQSGDVLVVNNHRALHARSAFSDPARLLLRISVC